MVLPHNYTPRDYQIPLLKALDDGYKNACVVWHRRAGKDKTLLNLVIKKMFERVGSYYYFFPTYNQGKKVLWDGAGRDGFKFMAHFPPELVKKKNDTELKVETINGSIFQIIGTNNIDSIVGTNPVGCVYSEYALQDPRAYDYMAPITAENGGFNIFNFTPRGENHGYQLFEYARQHPDRWFTQILTVDDTHVIPQDTLEQERQRYIAKDGTDAVFQQEYYCSFKVPIQGAYYAPQLMEAQEKGRIGKVPYDPALKVNTYWDLGIGDSTSIWFAQVYGKEIRLIDYYETNGEGLNHYVKKLQEKGYVYGEHYAPHDISVKELGTGKSRLEVAEGLGIKFEIAPKLSLEDGIDAVRNILTRCWFDEENTRRGLNALKSYHKVFDEENKIYKDKPEHDWSSHGSDAFRYLAVSYQDYVEHDDYPDDTQMFQGGFY